MLKLNIWTPSLTGKRAGDVLHSRRRIQFGSSYELPSHEGAQMARHHDVVQISVNHRLNALGFLDVSEIGGAAYADSVNVGMTDLVAALQVGSGEHCELRRRSGQRDDLWPVRRRLQSGNADGHAVGEGTRSIALDSVGRRRRSTQGRSEGVCAPGDEGTRREAILRACRKWIGTS